MDIVQDLVDGTSKNVVRLTAVAGTGSGTSLTTPATCNMVCISPSGACPDGEPDVASTGIIETANLYTAARFEVVARFPQVLGVVSAVWTFHFEVRPPHAYSGSPHSVPSHTPMFACSCTVKSTRARTHSICPTCQQTAQP